MVGATGFEPATPCAQDGKEEATRGSARPLPRFFLINSITWGNTRTHRAATACHPFVTRLSIVLIASKQTLLGISNNCFSSSRSVRSRSDTRISGHRSASVFPLAVDTTNRDPFLLARAPRRSTFLRAIRIRGLWQQHHRRLPAAAWMRRRSTRNGAL